MKEITTPNYKKIESSFEGQVYSPEMEDEFVGDVEIDNGRRKKNNFYSKGVPSAYKARHPSSVLVDKERYKSLGDLGRQRGYVEDLSNPRDISQRLTRIQKAIERDSRIDSDRTDFYNGMGQDELQRIADDVAKFERDNPGRPITDSTLKMLLRRMEKTRVSPPDARNRGVTYAPPQRQRRLRQLNTVAYTIDDGARVELSEESEVTTILNLLHFLDDKIQDFADQRGIDPESLKEFLGL
jgi:hypothetical protein